MSGQSSQPRMTFEFDKNDFVLSVKHKIQKEQGIPQCDQFLHFSGKHLEDDRCLADYNIDNESILFLNDHIKYDNIEHERSSTIFVKTVTGKRIKLNVNCNDTVAYIKQEIEEREGIPCKQQRVTFAGRQLEDDCRLSNPKMLRCRRWNVVWTVRTMQMYAIYICDFYDCQCQTTFFQIERCFCLLCCIVGS